MAGLIILVLGVIGYLNGLDAYLTHPETAEEIAPQLRELKAIQQLEQTNPELAKKQLDTMMESAPSSKLKRWYNIGFKAAVTDVIFYGKVIDQHGKPVDGAKVTYLVEGQFLAAGSGQGWTLTDNQGMFLIEGEGAKITVQDIIHPQINYNPPLTTKNSILTAGRNVPDRIVLWKKYTADNPYLFKAWWVEEFENVLAGWTRESLPPDGTVFTYNVLGKKKRRRIPWVEGEVGGHFRFSCERSEMSKHRDYKDWKVTITPVDGGIQQTDDIYQNVAPETGYQPSFVLEQLKSSPDYQHQIINQRYFFYANNGASYGSLFVRINPHRFRSGVGECKIVVSYKINLNGSRNLAVKETQY